MQEPVNSHSASGMAHVARALKRPVVAGEHIMPSLGLSSPISKKGCWAIFSPI